MPIATPQGTLDFKSVDTITFVGASSNTVIDTTTGSLGVGVDGNGPTSNLHVVGDALITGNVSDLNIVSNVNMLHTSNTAALKVNSNVVTEFPRSKKLIKYPRVALTGYSQDGYVVSSTTNYYDSGNPLYPWQVFNDSGYRYQSIRSDYSTSNGNYTGTVNQTTVNGSLIGGEWVQLQLPDKISLNRFTVALNLSTHGGRMGKSYTLAGSNDGSSWTTVSTHTQSYGNGSDGKDVNHDVNSTTMYKYYRLIATATFAAEGPHGGSWALGKWKLFGTPEYDPEADGVDVVVKSVPNVPNTDWLEVYYDAKDYTSVTTTVDNKTGVSAQDATITNSGGTITFNDEYKAWTFGGTDPGPGSDSTRTDTFIATMPSSFSGNQVHSVSTWFRYEQTFGDDAIFSISPSSGEDTNKSIGVRLNEGSNYQILYYHWSNDIRVNFPRGHKANTWYHMVVTYTGSITDVHRGKSVYIDGELCPFVSESTTGELNLDGGDQLQLARRNNGTKEFFGSIANFRVFNRALTSDEIYQLYAYQKEYFGHGDLSMTLKAGRLGIGTSEPRAALDVRGDVHISGSLRKTRARMIRLESGAKHFTLDGWQTYVSYGEAWTAYSSDPLYSISITGDYVEGGRAINYRIAVQNQRTDEVLYFPSSSGWIKYHYVDNTRLDGHGYLGIMSGLTFGDSYKVQLEVDPNSTNDYQWNAGYGTITGLVWD